MAKQSLWNYNLLPISTYSLFAKLRYWKDSKSKWVIADNWIQPRLSMKTAFLGFLSTVVGCQEKTLLALQMIWRYSGLVLVLYVIEKNEYFWLLNYLANFARGVINSVFTHLLSICGFTCIPMYEERRQKLQVNKHVRLGQSHIKWSICYLCHGPLTSGSSYNFFFVNVLSCSIPLWFKFQPRKVELRKFDLNFNPGRLGYGILILSCYCL